MNGNQNTRAHALMMRCVFLGFQGHHRTLSGTLLSILSGSDTLLALGGMYIVCTQAGGRGVLLNCVLMRAGGGEGGLGLEYARNGQPQKPPG